MRNDIIDYLQNEIRKRCESPLNKFGIGIYSHIEAVAKNAALLAEQFGADKEVTVIAAWLHDIASITDYSLYKMHHIHGAETAGEILRNFDYDPEKIKLVQECIKNHRGSVLNKKSSPEEICVADADAVSHFDSIPSLLYLAFSIKKMGYEDGVNFVANKLKRSFDKLSDKSKEFYAEKYSQSLEFLIGQQDTKKHQSMFL